MVKATKPITKTGAAIFMPGLSSAKSRRFSSVIAEAMVYLDSQNIKWLYISRELFDDFMILDYPSYFHEFATCSSILNVVSFGVQVLYT